MNYGLIGMLLLMYIFRRAFKFILIAALIIFVMIFKLDSIRILHDAFVGIIGYLEGVVNVI